jgi:iron(III) transport system substrate-binding protein
VLNLYSAPLPDRRGAVRQFHQGPGIKIKRVDADDAGILARLKSEGTPAQM